MIDAATIEGIADVPLFRNWSSEQMTCLGGGEEVIVPAGGRIAEEGVCAAYFFVLLSGRVRVTKREGEMETEITTYAPGTFFGELPILMDTPYVASAYAAENCRLLRLGREAFWHLLSRCPSASRDILHTMANRVQHLESITQERERLAALGTLAAGLAHEVNNPMAAGSRAISQARDAGARQLAALRLLTPALTPAQWDALFAAAPSAALETGALEMGVREDALAGWLDGREMSGDLAPGLAEAGWSECDLDTLAAGVPDSALSPAMAWLEARAAAETALETAARSARRVSEMVGAIREYTFLDQGRAQSVDIAAALENTLTILGSRLVGLQVARDFAPDLPPITGDGAELNQVWTALLDNALDAAGPDACLSVRAALEDAHVLVEIRDNGPGIPEGILPRIFEPFFTTKEVGQGTGLGLDIARRVITKHGGDIRVLSQPGDTRVQVRLPIEAAL